VSDILRRFKEYWSQQPQDPSGIFQYRHTGVPGMITNPGSQAGTYQTQFPISNVAESPELKSYFLNREQRYPREGSIRISEDYAQDPDTYRHEAAHSLYNQAVSPDNQDMLSRLAGSLGMYRPASHPALTGTEAAAYEVQDPSVPKYGLPEVNGRYTAYPSAGQNYMNAVVSSARTPDEQAAAQRLFSLYMRQKGSLAK